MDKPSQRRELRTIIANVSDKAEQSEEVARLLQNAELPKGSICIYNSLPSEVDTKAIIEYFCQIRDVYLPVVDGEDMLLVKVDRDTKYQEAKWGIFEPIGRRYLPSEIRPAVTLTPLLGVDSKLNRLGKGKGYYDRYFQEVDTFKVGLAFREQVIDRVICDSWDKPLDMLVTRCGIVARQDI